MKITRCGTSANYGPYSIDLDGLSPSWNNDDKCIVLKKRQVRDFTSCSFHDYAIHLKGEDFKKIIKILSNNSIDNNFDKIKSLLAGTERDMHRLISIAAGIFPSTKIDEDKNIS